MHSGITQQNISSPTPRRLFRIGQHAQWNDQSEYNILTNQSVAEETQRNRDRNELQDRVELYY